jgi:hypothetical protein
VALDSALCDSFLSRIRRDNCLRMLGSIFSSLYSESIHDLMVVILSPCNLIIKQSITLPEAFVFLIFFVAASN